MKRLVGFLYLFIFLIGTSVSFAKTDGDYLFVSGKFSANKNWVKFSTKHELNISHLLQILQKSKSGRILIKMAQRKADSYGKTLYDLIEAGNGSITDTTLIRRFSPSHPENIVYETRSKVYLNRHLNEYDALLDLAHELTHFVYRKGFNPYKKNFSLSDFIKNTIEGKGGEVQAFMTECRVLYDLFPRKLTSRYNCKQIIDPATGKLSYAKAVDRFYSIGSYFPKFHTRLSNKGILESFPSISSDEITFVSSAYGVPYPIAAYHEYMTVMTKVCENDKKRISYLTQSLSSGRKPASTNISQVQQEYLDRCTGIKIE